MELSSELAGNYTETITTGTPKYLAQTLTITAPESGEETTIRLVPDLTNGMAFFEYEIEDSNGNVEITSFYCMDECEDTKTIGDLVIDFAADLSTGLYSMNYTTPDVMIDQMLDTESQMWSRIVSANDTEQYFRTWDYEFINLDETPTFLYDLDIKVYGNEIFSFDEKLQLFPGFTNFTYEVMRDDEVADEGDITFVLADPENQKVIFNEKEMICAIDSSRKCTVSFYD